MATKKISPSAGDAASKKQAAKGFQEFANWINGKDVRGGPEAQKKAAAMRAARIKNQLTNKPGGQTRRAPAKRLPGTK